MSWDIIGRAEKQYRKGYRKEEETDLDATDQSTGKNKVQVLLVAASRNKVENTRSYKVSGSTQIHRDRKFSMVRSLVETIREISS